MLNKILQTSYLILAVGLSSVTGVLAKNTEIPIPFPTIDQIKSHLRVSTPEPLEQDPLGWSWVEYMLPQDYTIEVDGRNWEVQVHAGTNFYEHNELPHIPPTLNSSNITTVSPSELDIMHGILMVSWTSSAPGWPSGSRVFILAAWHPGSNTHPTNTKDVRIIQDPSPHFAYTP